MSDFVDASHVFLDNPATTRDEVLEFIAEKAVELGVSDDKDAVLKAFQDREAAGSTGMVSGFAIPHAKTDAVKSDAIIVVKLANDVDWGKTQDGEPTRVAVALLVPASDRTRHLRILAQVATLIVRDSFRSEIAESNDAAKIAAAVSAGIDA